MTVYDAWHDAEQERGENAFNQPEPSPDPARLAFMAGWWINAAEPEDAQRRAYFDGCAERDWQEYQSTGRAALEQGNG